MQVNVHDAKSTLSKLISRAESGEDIIIARAGKPAVRLVPITEPPKPRVPGGMKGKIWMSDDFDDYLPDEFKEAFGLD